MHARACTCLRTDNTWWSLNTIAMQDLWTKDSCMKNSYRKRQCFRGVSTDFWIRPTTWLHSVHDIAVPISRSSQHSWWGLVLAKTCPVQCGSLIARACVCACMYVDHAWECQVIWATHEYIFRPERCWIILGRVWASSTLHVECPQICSYPSSQTTMATGAWAKGSP